MMNHYYIKLAYGLGLGLVKVRNNMTLVNMNVNNIG